MADPAEISVPPPPGRALLPAGLGDLLPPDAEVEQRLVEHLLSVFAGYGYERVKPPLIEFESEILSGAGAALESNSFRVMDPVSGRMMAVRADITVQIARIAASRLGHAPRPLRLSYAGEVLTVRGSLLRPERQFGQVGLELIGAETPTADAEVILVAAEALCRGGVPRISIDLTLPTLVPAVLDAAGLDPERQRLIRAALDSKDAVAVNRLEREYGLADTTSRLLDATGPAARALNRLDALSLPPDAAAERSRLHEVIALVHAVDPDLPITVDPVENRGFEYHCGLSFTVFGHGVRGELGRGGRYLGPGGDAATGVSLYTDSIRRALPAPRGESRVYLPFGTSAEVGRRLRAEGRITVAGLAPETDPVEAARHLGCRQVWRGGTMIEIGPAG